MTRIFVEMKDLTGDSIIVREAADNKRCCILECSEGECKVQERLNVSQAIELYQGLGQYIVAHGTPACGLASIDVLSVENQKRRNTTGDHWFAAGTEEV